MQLAEEPLEEFGKWKENKDGKVYGKEAMITHNEKWGYYFF